MIPSELLVTPTGLLVTPTGSRTGPARVADGSVGFTRDADTLTTYPDEITV